MGQSAAGGWDGEGVPKHGDFLRPRPSGNVHIAWAPLSTSVLMACGKQWGPSVLDPADADDPRQCASCWEAM